MNTKHVLLMAAALMPLAALAQAPQANRGLNYTYVEADYLNTDLDSGIDGDGLGLTASFSINNQIFAFANYTKTDYNYDIDSNVLEIGAGMHWPLQSNLDVFGKLSWIRAKVDAGPFDDSDNGIGLELGLRGRLNNRIELQGGIHYVDVGHSGFAGMDGSQTSLRLGGRYYLTDSVAIGAGYDINNDDNRWTIGLRAEFGP